MSESQRIKKIMRQIALSEEKRIKRLMWIVLLTLASLLFIWIYSACRTILSLLEKGTLEIISSFEYDWDIILQELQAVGILILEDIEKEAIITLVLSLLTFVLLLTKTDFFSLPTRLKEIKKYKK
jgi:hypothetical protein